jgi:MFS family permease
MHEKRAISSIALIMSFRMLGLFMILPVFTVAAEKMPLATPTLIGLAFGIYGFSQACLQIPFGSLSDRFGRKPIILFGLVLFAIGSIIAALSHTIYGLIIGRALQGSGAIGSTLLALVADLTRDESRSKAMATIGLTIGFAFSIALVLGPTINAWFHLSGIFWMTALFAGISMLLLFTTVPNPPKLVHHQAVEPDAKRFKKAFTNLQLLRLDLGIFCMHAMLMAVFYATPLLLTKELGFTESNQVLFYLSLLVVSFGLMLPFIIIAEKKRLMKPVFISSIITLLLSQLCLFYFHQSVVAVIIIFLLFFTAFTLLEASLPSLISKIAPIKNKGTAMGIYSTSQFLGTFVGGFAGGWLYGHFQYDGIFLFGAVLAFIWLSAAISMPQPPYLSTKIYKATESMLQDINAFTTRLQQITGVAEVALMPEEKLVYVKVDKKILAEDKLQKEIGTN